MKMKDEVVFQVVRTILPNQELVAYLHRNGAPETLTDVFMRATRRSDVTSTPDLSKGMPDTFNLTM
ncbi:hypothetical protein DPMN_007644 [Dreissena polymorpha]|uniref:Uncharacterized protein n=1 Tax=Dreissena polymorpha TaxID=45954 RepID=A0A9D4MXR2_DREPO|nr:hypothetical protein DPMN_007644 [Dreissena polymorpha]